MRVFYQNDYGLCSLEISAARLEDSGLYIVRASNIEGQVSCSALLQVDLGQSPSWISMRNIAFRFFFSIDSVEMYASCGTASLGIVSDATDVFGIKSVMLSELSFRYISSYYSWVRRRVHRLKVRSSGGRRGAARTNTQALDAGVCSRTWIGREDTRRRV